MANINNKDKVKKMMKKYAGLGLCAILVGGTASGAMAYSNHGSIQVSAADSEKIKLLKNDSETDAEETKAEESEDTAKAKGNLDVSDIVEQAMPSVVSITNKSVQEVQDYYSSVFGFYGYAPNGGTTEQEVEASGSGIIIGKNDKELLVVTNYHVLEDADTISVGFTDGAAAEAKLKGYDKEKDVAVIAVTLDDLSDDTKNAITIAKIGSSNDLKVGEQVVAIGNALGYGQSVTTGIVSAKNRYIDDTKGVIEEYEDQDGVNLIQTDAAINPGNSGGALLNMEGEVVGINSAKLVQTEVEGMCYAIAISDVEDIIENLMNEETRDKLEDDAHGVLGIMGRTVDETTAEYYNIPKGVYVAEITKNGAAEEAGLKEGMIITKFAGKKVTTIEQLVEMLGYYAPGEEVEVTIGVMKEGGYGEENYTLTLKEQEKTDESEDNDDDRVGLFKEWKDGMEEDGMFNGFFNGGRH